jgi:class 3 adenylate cyclase
MPAMETGRRSAVTLRFDDPELEARFRDERAVELRPFVRVGFAMASLIWLLGVLTIPYATTQNVRLVQSIALGFAIATVCGLVSTRWLRSFAGLQGLAAAFCGASGFVLLTGTLLMGHFERYGALLLMAALAYAFTTLQIRFVLGVLSQLPYVVAYAAIAFATGRAVALSLDLLVLFWTLLVIGFTAYVLESSARDLFVQRLLNERQQREIEREKEKSERLLLNVLPQTIAARLKEREERIAERFDEATVLFADIVGFTPLSASMEPEQIVALLDDLFTKFDALAERHGLEKIKTIGDAYMVVGGVPQPRADHAEAVAQMALEMVSAVAGHRAGLSVRVGVHSGPVVAGVIGRKKFIYDLWGDTVNTASRMESHGLPGAVQITPETWQRIQHSFSAEPRGSVEIKGKGPMNTLLLTGRPENAKARS